MKTYLKGIKTVAVIFLSLALFSCQDEQIELQDTLSTTPDELMLNKGPRVNFLVTLNKGTLGSTTDNLLLSVCDGTVNSVQTLLWFNDCTDDLGETEPAFSTTYLDAENEYQYFGSSRRRLGKGYSGFCSTNRRQHNFAGTN